MVLAVALFPVLCPLSPAFAQCADGSPPPCTRPAARASAAPAANSVGVMLFTNLAHDTAFAYLADGLASEIATSLSRVPRLEVRSPSAVRSAMRGSEADARTVGRRLNVRYVVEGEFQRGGDRIRVAARLVTVASGTQRWSDAWTRPATDLLAVQEEIARAVAAAIAGQLLPEERTVLTARVTRDPEAYDHFLRGNFQLARRTPESVAGAISEYETATRRDPSFAQAEARIALAYALYLDWGWDFPGLPRDSMLARGARAADRALALDTLSADAWMVRGYMRSLRFPRTLDGVLTALERATLLDPRNAEAWHQYGWMLWSVGRWEEAEAATRRALALEPGRTISWGQLGNILESQGRDDDARTAYDSASSLSPEFYGPYSFRTWVRLRAGDVQGAQGDAEAALRMSPPGEEYYGAAALAAVAAYRGDTLTARGLVERAVEPFATRAPGPMAAQFLARGLIAAGRPEEAVALMEQTVPLGALLWAWLNDRAFDPIRNEARFQRLLEATRPEGAR